MSSSSSSQKARTTNVTKTRNLNLEDIEGLAVAGNDGPVNIKVLDQGAINQAFAFGSEALRKNESITGGAFKFGATALDFLYSALDADDENQQRALDTVTSSTSEAIQAAVSTASSDLNQTIQTLGVFALVAVGGFVVIQVFAK